MTDTRYTELSVRGMSCSHCAHQVHQALESVEGVESVSVRLEEGRARVRWRGDAAHADEKAIQAVQESGFEASRFEAGEDSPAKPERTALDLWRLNVVLGTSLTLPLLIGEWALGLGEETWFRWLGLGLSAPVMLICGSRFFRGAWKQLKRGRSNMDTLVTLGSTTAFGFSLWGLLAGLEGHLYFMEAGAIITVISAGHWLEALAGSRAASSLKALMRLAPERARLLEKDGTEREVAVSSLAPDDRVVLRPGDHVPTDGEVLEGQSAIDESMLTGESLPVDKQHGSSVFAGTSNTSGRLVVRVSATGEETALARIVEAVRRAQGSRARIQRLGDSVASVFVPVVVLVALASALWWLLAYDTAVGVHQALAGVLWQVHVPETALAAACIHAAAVLIVACPCAMGLATPVAILVGTSVAARRGILIRDGSVLEKSGTITAVVFDKTGTITEGELTVEAYRDLRRPGESEGPSREIGAFAKALARPSRHPLSQALVRELEGGSSEVTLESWEEVRGRGVTALLDGTRLRLGSLAWIHENGVEPEPASPFAGEWSGRGASVLGLSVGDRLAGVFALGDKVKPGAREVVSHLSDRGLAIHLITGDGSLTARSIADQVGIPPGNVFSEIPPEEKATMVQALQQRGEKVAFVGDGINDAPALEQSDLGIAVSRASDVAREAADLVLLNSDIQAIPDALGLARSTLRTIRQNLFWAFFYNAAAVPLAALGFLHPIVCAVAMGASDIMVIGNALRLERHRP